MTFLVVALSVALSAAQTPEPPEEDSTFSERQPVRLTPLPAERAFAAFRDICMAGISDPAALDRAAAASDLGFVRGARAGGDIHEWNSRHGQIVLRPAQQRDREARGAGRGGPRQRGPRLRWLARCDFWVAIDERLEPGNLVAAIGRHLAPDARPAEEIIGVSWDLGAPQPNTSLKLLYLPSSDEDPRLFTLSLQLVPAYSRP